MEAAIESSDNLDKLKILFDTKLKDQLQDLDEIRKEAVKRCYHSIVPVCMSLLVALFLTFTGRSEAWLIFCFPGLVSLVMYYYVSLKWKAYRDAYKTQVVGKLLKTFNDSFEYSPSERISRLC